MKELIVLVYMALIGGEPAAIYAVQPTMNDCLIRVEQLAMIIAVPGPQVDGNATIVDVELKTVTCKRMTEEEFFNVG